MQLGELISASVGNNMENHEGDVLRVKSSLAEWGLFNNNSIPEPHGFITREMDEGIQNFQFENGLKVDGVLYPNGETENALLGRKVELSSDSALYDATGRMVKENTIVPLSVEDEGDGDKPPKPPRKPKPPQKDGDGNDGHDSDSDNSDGKQEDTERDDKEDEGICDDLFEEMYNIHDEIAVLGKELSDVLSELNPKRIKLERLKKKNQEKYSKVVPSPFDVFEKPKGPAVALDVIDMGMKAKEVYDLSGEIKKLEKEVNALQKKADKIDKRMQVLRQKAVLIYKKISEICPDREM